jgi:hypothetical protein
VRRLVRVPIWLVGAAWIGWPLVGRFLFHHWIPGRLLMRAGPGGQDTEFLVYSPLEQAVFWLLVGVVPVVLTLAWWYSRVPKRRLPTSDSSFVPPN